MNSSQSKNALSIHSNSKKIQEASASKQYQTFSKDEHKLIINDLKKHIAMHFGLSVIECNFSAESLLGYVEDMGLGVYNKILTKILSKHNNPSVILDTKTLTQWRKKIKGWIKSEEKPERRGGLVVPPEYLDYFLETIKCILNSMPYRCFELLKSRILEVLEKIHNMKYTEPNAKSFDAQTCSKHWWHDFVHKYPDIKQQWESLLLKRTVEAKNTSPKKYAKESGRKMSKGFESDQDTLPSPDQYSELTFGGDYPNQTNYASSENSASPQRNLELHFFAVEAEPMFHQEETKQEAWENLFEQPSSPSHFIAYDQEDNFFMENECGMKGDYGFDNESNRFCLALPHEVSTIAEQIEDFGFGTNFNWM